jgi:hypothetical protein
MYYENWNVINEVLEPGRYFEVAIASEKIRCFSRRAKVALLQGDMNSRVQRNRNTARVSPEGPHKSLKSFFNVFWRLSDNEDRQSSVTPDF